MFVGGTASSDIKDGMHHGRVQPRPPCKMAEPDSSPWNGRQHKATRANPSPSKVTYVPMTDDVAQILKPPNMPLLRYLGLGLIEEAIFVDGSKCSSASQASDLSDLLFWDR